MQPEEKQVYETPELTEHGSLEAITLGGVGSPPDFDPPN